MTSMERVAMAHHSTVTHKVTRCHYVSCDFYAIPVILYTTFAEFHEFFTHTSNTLPAADCCNYGLLYLIRTVSQHVTN